MVDDLSEKKRLIVHKLHRFLQEINTLGKEKKLSLLIFTNFGKIECMLADPESTISHPVGFIFSSSIDLANIDEVSALYLKDAKISPYGSQEPTQIVEDMILFTDQIVGLSFT